MFLDFQPDYLFHLGAFTNLEYCEQHPNETYITNTLSVENGVYIAQKLNIPLLYISTAGIYDGKKKLYDDWDLPNPLGIMPEVNMLESFLCRDIVLVIWFAALVG